MLYSRFYIADDQSDNSSEPSGRVCIHPVPPSALAWPQPGPSAAGCDRKVIMYSSSGKVIRSFDYSRNESEKDFR